jgi:hypothetical protein
VQVGVTSISASSRAAGGAETPTVVDPRLAPLAKKLQALFAYTRYAFLGKAQTEAPPGRAAVIQLPERFTLEVQPEQPRPDSEGRLELMVTLFRESGRERDSRGREDEVGEVVLRTRIRLENGGTVLLGGPPISGGVLILALTARI